MQRRTQLHIQYSVAVGLVIIVIKKVNMIELLSISVD